MRKAVLSKRASDKLDKLLNYLETEWSENVKQNFIKKFDDSVKFISSFPEATEESNFKKGLHRCVGTNQTTVELRQFCLSTNLNKAQYDIFYEKLNNSSSWRY